MVWMGMLVGATIGGITVGPVGFIIGLMVGGKIGSLMDEESSDASTAPTAHPGRGRVGAHSLEVERGMHLRWLTSPDGVEMFLSLVEPAPVDAFAVAFQHADSGAYVRGRPPFQDGDGDFVVVLDGDAEGEALGFVPFSALDHRAAATYILRVTALDADRRSLGYDLFDMELPTPTPTLNMSAAARPFVELGLLMARVGGKLNREGLGVVRGFCEDVFDLGPASRPQLNAVMKGDRRIELEALIGELSRRMPRLPPDVVMSMLAAVARGAGMSAAHVKLARQIALHLGLSPESWSEAAVGWGFSEATTTTDARAAALALLDLDHEATPAQIKAAFRAKITDYHPDKVAHLPADFQTFAHERAAALNAAYAALSGA